MAFGFYLNHDMHLRAELLSDGLITLQLNFCYRQWLF
jgi:hypothetical protein